MFMLECFCKINVSDLTQFSVKIESIFVNKTRQKLEHRAKTKFSSLKKKKVWFEDKLLSL